MALRPITCDDDRCEPTSGGTWIHVPGCWTVEEAEPIGWLDDMQADELRTDGYQPRRAA